VERLTERSTKRIGQAVATTTTRGAKGSAFEAPRRVSVGPAPPPRLHSRLALRRLCCSDWTGSDETAAGKGPIGLGGPGLRDPLEDLKVLVLLKLEKWWCEIAYKNMIPPATDTAAKSVPPRLRPTRGISRLTAESSSDETVGLVAVARRKRGSKSKGQKARSATPFDDPRNVEEREIRGTDVAVVTVVIAENRDLGIRDGGLQQQ
jgi:hypothetical protein